MYPDENNIFLSKYVVAKYDNNIKGLSPYSIYAECSNHKVIHRSQGYLMIHQGNHDVSMKGYTRCNTDDIVIYYFPVRGINQFYKKYYCGAKAIYDAYGESNNIASHWKYYYKRFIEDGVSVEDEHDKHIEKNILIHLCAMES